VKRATGFQVRGRILKKMRRAEGGAKIFGVFRVKNHDFTPKNYRFMFVKGHTPCTLRRGYGFIHLLL
jgi:hypothetical protein